MKDWKKLLPDKTVLVPVHYTKGRSGHKVVGVGVHYNAGNLTTEDCKRVWLTRPASAHYQVEDDGLIGQLVYDSNTAWALGDWDANCKTISIEHANEPNGTITEKCLDNGAHLVAAICHHYGLGRPEWLKNVFPHKHFQSTSCPGQIYGSQKDAYIERCQYWYDKMAGKDVDKPAKEPEKEPEKKYSLKIDGVQGRYTNLALQEFLRSQRNWKGELCYGTGFALDGVFGSGTVLAWQEYLRTKGFYGSGLRLDGDFGYYTKLAAQEWLRTEKNLSGELCYGKGFKLDGVWGEGSVLALQECLRAKGFYN